MDKITELIDEVPESLVVAFLEIRDSAKYNMYDAYGVTNQMLVNDVMDALWLIDDRSRVHTDRYQALLKAVTRKLREGGDN